jgi:hypothetical protein
MAGNVGKSRVCQKTYLSGLYAVPGRSPKLRAQNRWNLSEIQNVLLSQAGTANVVFHRDYRHVVEQNTSCSTCHSSHGIQVGTSINNAHLVDFDKNVVGPDNIGRLYLDTTARACCLTCHGVLHNPKTYYWVAKDSSLINTSRQNSYTELSQAW